MRLCYINLKEINNQIPLQNEPIVDPSQNEIIENNQEVFEQREEQPTKKNLLLNFIKQQLTVYIALRNSLGLNMQ